jgi:hypothetical protein
MRSGEIAVHRGSDPGLGRPQRDPSVFGSALAVIALGWSHHPVLRPLVARAGRYIAGQRRRDGTWPYWPAPVEWISDADDTACCSLALLQSGCAEPAEVRGNVAIFEEHRDASGLFQTWFHVGANHDGANDVDSVVNANVLCYLGARPSTMEAAEYLVDLVLTGRECGSYRYYVDSAALHCAMARAMDAVPRLRRCERVLIGKLRERVAAPAGALLPIAQSLTALALRGVALVPECASSLDWLLAAQMTHGSWPEEACYAGPEPGRRLSAWYGSAELSTVLCLEALLRAMAGQSGYFGL